MTVLHRYVYPLTVSNVAAVIKDTGSISTEAMGIKVNFNKFRVKFKSLCGDGKSVLSDSHRAKWDQYLAEILYGCMSEVPLQIAYDMRLWHWLCTVELSDFVWSRWFGQIPDQPAKVILDTPRGFRERFVGSPTLHGVSRNALARLYWCARALYNKQEKHKYVRKAFQKQDLFQAIFERRLGLHTPAVRACLDVYLTEPEDVFRKGLKRLDHHLTTHALESMNIKDIKELIMR
ncbi:DUF6339 family protein [candidate division KSB1 bacterium]